MNEEQEYPIDLTFPTLGVEVAEYGFDQRQGTSPRGVNVRGYDAATLRLRGGTRGGLTPFLGQGDVNQVSGFNPIQSLSTIITADQAATFNNAFSALTLRLDYSETNNPPARNAPQLNLAEKWYENSSGSYTGITGVIVGTPDGGGTGQGTATFKVSTDGTTVTLVATFVSAGFPGPYFYSGPSQVQTITQSNLDFFNPALSKLAGSWTVVAGSYIAVLPFNLFYT